ncbi:GWxTD domain-containing protein [Sulfidibacter corallicola]|uniref:GWxTD domain-containing protein n=1 Tax=Sulfidibacter corallicola TaxID=2818388 RepID=A0A8A4TU95_SULCO|nr:GWxTD domain-containing protein [Sulfidibacter corallicola]QTD52937.1 GWxTD domain-containing protein [Sulfidibacter corallicola]
MNFWRCVWILSLTATPLWAQKLNLGSQEDFLTVVDPIITKGELEIYKALPNMDNKRYFQGIFWYKRDPRPETAKNSYRRAYFERRQIAVAQFGEGKKSGPKTDRGRAFLLLGEPENVTQRKLSDSGLLAGYEEVWEYPSQNVTLRFLFDSRANSYRLVDKEKWEPRFEEIRELRVLDRAEPYRLRPLPLTLPYLGFTKDIENLASDDRFELDFALSYYFLKGDQNRTEVLVGLTLYDASKRGIDVNLTAYDPYQHKVVDFKKRFDLQNGDMKMFSVVMEPDQYDLVLRVHDRDGREGIDRRRLDVPRLTPLNPAASSLLIARGFEKVPLEGFTMPKKFVYAGRFFPVEHDFVGYRGDRLFLMRYYYGYQYLPQSDFYLNGEMVPAKVEAQQQEEDGLRVVYSIPFTDRRAGVNEIQAVFVNESGNGVTDQAWVNLDPERQPGFRPPLSPLLSEARDSEGVRLVLPAKDEITALDRVVVRPDPGVQIRKMSVFLNGRLILETRRSPWEVSVDQGLFSISGQNILTVVCDTSRGLVRLERELAPLRADEKIKTRLVQVFFNAFDPSLSFLHDLDFGKLRVTVDDKAVKPVEVEKIEEPITYCFLVDTSFSMKDSFKDNVRAVKRFIESMRPDDSGIFVSFSDNYVQYLEPNRSKAVLLSVAEALDLQQPNPKHGDKLYEENETFLYDSVIAAIHTLLQYPGRKVIVLVSDGIGIEGKYSRNGMLSYARENDVVIYSLWLDNNPGLSDEETAFLQKETGKAEKFVRAIGLSRLFAKKDEKKNYVANKVRFSSINQGVLKILSEESGGFHYRIFRADRSKISEYVRDIEKAVESQFVMTLNLPVSIKTQHVQVDFEDDDVSIRAKSEIKVRKTNPLLD